MGIMDEMKPAKSKCRDCPWYEPENQGDMLSLIDRGETLWPCHNTASVHLDDEGRITSIDQSDRNRVCFGYQQYAKTGVLPDAI